MNSYGIQVYNLYQKRMENQCLCILLESGLQYTKWVHVEQMSVAYTETIKNVRFKLSIILKNLRTYHIS